MHFTYDENFKKSPDLMQGDILKRTEEIDSLLKETHPHYFYNKNNKYFIVLTQSCDLVRRKNKPCIAKFISIAAVKSFKQILGKKINEIAEKKTEENTPICSAGGKTRLEMLLERIFNNNESDYFFLRQEPLFDFPEDCCAVLRLSIALKAKQHYESCLNSRILSLNEEFRAKLGWLVGNIYSRVGTQDWEEKEIKETLNEYLIGGAIWVENKKLSKLKRKIEDWEEKNPQSKIDDATIASLIEEIPQRKEQFLSRLEELFDEHNIINDNSKMQKLINNIRNDPNLSNLMPN